MLPGAYVSGMTVSGASPGSAGVPLIISGIAVFYFKKSGAWGCHSQHSRSPCLHNTGSPVRIVRGRSRAAVQNIVKSVAMTGQF